MKMQWNSLQMILMMVFFHSFWAKGQISSPAYKALLGTLYKNEVPLISCDSAQRLPKAVFLDTRARPEYEVSHLPGARWVGYDEFSLEKVRHIPRHTPVVVYCSVGVRSERVGKKMRDAGFTQVYNLYGSLFEWVNQEKPIVDAQGQPTQKVHAYSPTWGIWLRKGEKVYE